MNRRNGETERTANHDVRSVDGRREATRTNESIRGNEHGANRFVLVSVDRFVRTYRPAAQADPSTSLCAG